MLLLDLFPEQMSIRGDRGNVTTLKLRAQLSGHSLAVHNLHPGDTMPPNVSGVFIGSGPDYILDDLLGEVTKLAPDLLDLKNKNIPFLAIANGLRLLSEQFLSYDGKIKTGAGIYPISCGRIQRRVGEVILTSGFGELIGFENHDIEILHNTHPLGLRAGKNSVSPEPHGFYLDNLIACCLHGAFLPLNPSVADWFLLRITATSNTVHMRGACVNRENRDVQTSPYTLADIDFYARSARETIKKRIYSR